MALFGKKSEAKKQTEAKKAPSGSVKKDAKKSKKKAEKGAVAGRVISAKSLIRPRITEKAHSASERNQYVFEVRMDATKEDIRSAVRELYGVNVESVTTSRSKPKMKRRGRTVGYTKGIKKAYVSVKAGEKIELFEGI